MGLAPIPKGEVSREAIDALRGYVYQIYQSALAWIELRYDEFLFLEVAEDYSVVAGNALKGVQVKETGHRVTINSDDIIASIDSFVDLRQKNPELQIELRHLTTSMIGKEKSSVHRIGNTPTLEMWRSIARAGDVEPLRKILFASKLSKKTKTYIRQLDDAEFRKNFLKRIHFDCGALVSKYLSRQLRSKVLKRVLERGGVNSQVDGCFNSILMTLLHKATQKEDRFVDRNTLEELLERATQIPINRSQFETQNQLINKVLAASIPRDTNLVAARLSEPRPIDEVPLPATIASRSVQINNVVSSLTQYGVSWIYGAAGVGKTTGAKISARHLGGNWVGINLRGLNAEQLDAVLSSAIDKLTEHKIDGFLIDDLECFFEPHIVDKLLYLLAVCIRTDVLLLCTSSRPLSSDFLFSANLPASIQKKLEEFTEHDIREILAGLGVHNVNWVKYIHLISGGGHPQLAIAAIQSMQNSGWDKNEFRTLDSLFVGNPAIEQVRARTRERLLNELPETGRRLLERLSLKPGSFRRGFVLDMGQIKPIVSEAGIVFESLIGSWVDQQQIDRFSLSPLLSGYAAKTLAGEQKREINFEIANSLLKRQPIDPTEANSALIAALSGKNTQVIFRLCISILCSDQDQLKMISPHLMMFTFMRTDILPYEDDPVVSQMLRGAQLILLCQEEDGRERIQEALDRFEEESARVEDKGIRTTTALMVYAKLLFSTPKFGALPNFWELVRKFDVLLKNQKKQHSKELYGGVIAEEMDGVPIVSFMFLNQAMQIKLINELLPALGFLNSCGKEFRQKLLKPFNNPEFEVDMIVMGAWLKEYKANTIDPSSHSEVFSIIEKSAKSWGHTDLAVCCRKYRAIIIDEYGGDKEQALAILDEGMKLYGETNSELVRAKAKVLYRAEDHQGSLELSRVLINANAPLSKTEKAFLGREAAISAEKQGDYETARGYYLFGSNAAGDCNISDMIPMRIGLMADAALASWHAGDCETCLRDFVTVLQELNDIDPKDSLRAAHCHAVCRHVLLWLDQDATGEKRLLADGEETKIYPGVVSNPEPHSEIGERYITPIEMAWYMLATVENHSYLDVGITKSLRKFLPKGAILEGQFLLTSAKMKKAFFLHDVALFVTALRETVAEFAYVKERGDYTKSFDIQNITYGSLPIASYEQQISLSDHSEMFVLCFISNCIFSESVAEIDQLKIALEKDQGFKVRKEFLNAFEGHPSTSDYNISLAALLFIHRRSIDKNETLTPTQIFELAFKALQVAIHTKMIRVVAKSAFKWLNAKWIFILEHQRFLLKGLKYYEDAINQVRTSKTDSWIGNVIDLLKAILPTIGLKNETQLSRILDDMRKTKQ